MKKEEYHTITEDLGAKFEAAEKAIAELKKALVATRNAFGAERDLFANDIKYGTKQMSAADVFVALKLAKAIESVRHAENDLDAICTGARSVTFDAIAMAAHADPEVNAARA